VATVGAALTVGTAVYLSAAKLLKVREIEALLSLRALRQRSSRQSRADL
jgi:hypothetical protein